MHNVIHLVTDTFSYPPCSEVVLPVAGVVQCNGR